MDQIELPQEALVLQHFQRIALSEAIRVVGLRPCVKAFDIKPGLSVAISSHAGTTEQIKQAHSTSLVVTGTAGRESRRQKKVPVRVRACC